MTPPSTGRWCPTCRRWADRFLPGPSGGRQDASCPSCRSLERHRLLSVLVDGMGPWLAGADLVVDVAPHGPTAAQLRALCPQAYVGLDFDPAADDRHVDLRASVDALPLPDASVDLLTCYHVLEHVPDDITAMREMARVLKDGGLALVQVPWRRGTTTDEDPSAPADERVARFGQADHVRYYGDDFEDRLASAGLAHQRITAREVVGESACALMALIPGEAVWLVRADPRRRGAVAWGRPADVVVGHLAAVVADLRQRELEATPLIDTLGVLAEEVRLLRHEQAQEHAALVRRTAEEVAVARAEAAEAGRRAERWERAYRRLRGRLPVRLAAAAAARVLAPGR